MTAFAKGVKKVVKKVVKAAKKVYKKITESKLGKALLIGAAVFTGGAALGFWNMPAWIPGAAKINGALTKAGSQAAQAAATKTAAASTASAAAPTAASTGALAPGGGVLQVGQGGGMLAETAGQSLVKGVMPQAAGGTAANAMGAAPAIAAGTAPLAAPTVQAGAQQGQGSIISRLLESSKDKLAKTAGFIDKHPYASAMMMSSAANALSPDEQDLMELQWKRQDDVLGRQNRNMNVSGIDLGIMTPGKQTGLPRSNYWFLNGTKSGV